MTGQAIVKAILAGERNPRKLAEFQDKKSLTSHVFLPRQESLFTEFTESVAPERKRLCFNAGAEREAPDWSR